MKNINRLPDIKLNLKKVNLEKVNLGTNLRKEIKKNEADLLGYYNSLRFISAQHLISSAVSSTTFRAFRHDEQYLKYKPQSIFRVWAQDFLKDEILIKPSKIKFEELHEYAYQDLYNFWKNNDEKQPKFYQYNKLIDLLFKFLPRYINIEESIRDLIFKNANVPLDSFSLKKLRAYSTLNDIPKNSSMSYIENKKHYVSIQKEIKDLTYPYPPIFFDFLAWNFIHTKPFELEETKKKH